MNKNTILKGSLAIALGLIATSATASAIVAVDSNAAANTAITTKVATSSLNATVSASTSVNANSSTTNYQSSDGLMMQSGIMTGGNGSVSLPSNISSQTDLQSYQNTLMTTDSSIGEINTEEDSEVTVVWNQKGKLFAIFPVTVSTKTTVEVKDDNTTKVRADMPWWSVFVTDIADVSNDTEAKLESSNEVKAYANAKTNAQAKAQVVYVIVSELGERVLNHDRAIEFVRLWLHTEFEGSRHQTRLDKISALER